MLSLDRDFLYTGWTAHWVVTAFILLASVLPVTAATASSSKITATPSVIEASSPKLFTIHIEDPLEKRDTVTVGIHQFARPYSENFLLSKLPGTTGIYERTLRPSDSQRPELFAPGVHEVWYSVGSVRSAKTTYEVKATPTITITPALITNDTKELRVVVDNVPDSLPLFKTNGGTRFVTLWFWNEQQRQVNPTANTSVVLKEKVMRSMSSKTPQRHEYVIYSKEKLNIFPNGKTTVEAFDANMGTIVKGEFETKLETGCQRFLYNGPPAQKYDMGWIFPYAERNRARAIVNRYVEDGLKQIEPIRSNINKFNVWYRVLNESESKEYDAAVQKSLGNEDVDLTNPELRNLCGETDLTILFSPYAAGRSFHRAKTQMIAFYQHGDLNIPDITTLLHELGHALGGLGDEYIDNNIWQQVHNTLYGSPNCASSAADTRWSDMVPGRAGSGYVDSLTSRIGYFTGVPEFCFRGTEPIANCYFIGTMETSVFAPVRSSTQCTRDPEGNLAKNIPVKSGCMYQVAGSPTQCRVAGKPVACSTLKHPTLTGGCLSAGNFRSSIDSLMNLSKLYNGKYRSNLARSYGPVNERQICRRLQEVTGAAKGVMGSVCKSYGL